MTGKDLVKTAFDLCGLLQTDGSFPQDVDDLMQRAISLINVVLAETAELDGRIRKTEHTVSMISSLDDIIDCSEIVARSVLPFGLARLFMLGEDDALANEFLKLYRSATEKAIKFGKARITAIEEVY